MQVLSAWEELIIYTLSATAVMLLICYTWILKSAFCVSVYGLATSIHTCIEFLRIYVQPPLYLETASVLIRMSIALFF